MAWVPLEMKRRLSISQTKQEQSETALYQRIARFDEWDSRKTLMNQTPDKNLQMGYYFMPIFSCVSAMPVLNNVHRYVPIYLVSTVPDSEKHF